jgi:YidC/Oxa1 family membrane protein insertase
MTFRKLNIALLLVLIFAPCCVLASVAIDTESLRLKFNNKGELQQAEACFPSCSEDHAKTRVLSSAQGMLLFDSEDEKALQATREHKDGVTTLSFNDESGRVLRRWNIPDKGWLISVSSPHTGSVNLASGVDFRPAPSSGFGYLLEQSRYLVFEGASVETIALDETGAGTIETADWFGFRNRFWAVVTRPAKEISVTPLTGESVRDTGMRIQASDVAGGVELELYIGPIEPAALAQSASELESLMYSGLWFWLRWICQALYFLLSGIFMLIPQWGLAVMVLSLAVGILMRPLSRLADRLQDQVHEIDARLAPALAAIKKQYGGEEQSEKIIAMYKAEGVHPLYSLKSLAGVFVVIPVFIGAFDMLAENIHLSGESFLWIADLSNPDAFALLPFSLPFFGGYLNLLPFIMTLLSLVASKMHHHPSMDVSARRKHSRNLVLMALGFLVLFYTFPAGMVLYWTTNNLISVIKTFWKKRKLGVA